MRTPTCGVTFEDKLVLLSRRELLTLQHTELRSRKALSQYMMKALLVDMQLAVKNTAHKRKEP